MTRPANLPDFVARAETGVATAASTMRFSQTRARRVMRRFSVSETAMFLGFSRKVIHLTGSAIRRRLLQKRPAPAR